MWEMKGVGHGSRMSKRRPHTSGRARGKRAPAAQHRESSNTRALGFQPPLRQQRRVVARVVKEPADVAGAARWAAVGCVGELLILAQVARALLADTASNEAPGMREMVRGGGDD